jgi:hypothetical protein
VRQLTRGQRTMDKKMIPCDTPDMYGALKRAAKKKTKRPTYSPTGNPFPI